MAKSQQTNETLKPTCNTIGRKLRFGFEFTRFTRVEGLADVNSMLDDWHCSRTPLLRENRDQRKHRLFREDRT